MNKLSAPPGFISQTEFVLRNVHRDRENSRSVPRQEQTTGFGTDDADSFQRDLTERPWIVQDLTTPSSEALKANKSEVPMRRRLKISEAHVLKEAPVFNPNEEEFSETLSYISSLRGRGEPFGICCVVPPPSWNPPCLLKEKKIWEASSFATQVQLFGGIYTENAKIKKEVDVDSDDDAFEEVKFCSLQRGPSFNMKGLKDMAVARKKVLGSKNSSSSEEPTVAEIEKEYRQIVESPLVEIGVVYGNDIDTRTFGSGFPLPASSESSKYTTSGWNLNNTAKLPGSLLSFEDCESICVPRLSVGMCYTSQFWKSEKERLYALCYLHEGDPRLWYSVPACHRSKFKAIMKSLTPEPNSHDSVMMMSPYQMSMEGIPVTRCVQNTGQYVIIFPGSYYCAFDCGFNCLEKVNFAPLDWLPHGEVAVLKNQEKSKKSLISYDKLLLTAASETAKCLKEYSFAKRKTAWYMTLNDSCGKQGLLSNIFQSRIKQEKCIREFLTCSLESQRMDESYDAVRKRECCECFVDLHISAVKCSCSPGRYSCPSHMRKLCACPWDKKIFLYRYTIEELNYLVEALVGQKLSCMYQWVRVSQQYCASPAMTCNDSSREDDVAGIKEEVKVRSMAEVLNVKKETLVPCSNKKSNKPSDSSAVNKKQKHG